MSVRTTLYVETSDNVKIVGDVVLPDDDMSHGALLLHMMPSTRESYNLFQNILAELGIASCAIDLRGHGDSTLQHGRPSELSYRNFTDEEHQASIHDVRASFLQLRELTHLKPHQITIVGASIGANLALQFLREQPDVEKAVLLSPGLLYRGIDALSLAKHLSSSQKLLLVSTEGDEYSFQTSQQIHTLPTVHSELLTLPGNEHGTDMLENETAVKRCIELIQTR